MTFQPMSCMPTQTSYQMVMQPTIQLPKLESILETLTFLMDRVDGQC